MRRSSAALAAIVLAAAACSPSATPAPSAAPATATAPASPASSATPAAVSATPVPASPTGVRPSLPPDAPVISEPYWLVDGGTDTTTLKDKSGAVIKTMTGRTIWRSGGSPTFCAGLWAICS